MPLDIKTASLISFGLSLFLSLLMYIVYKRSVNIKGPGYWVYNNLLNAFSQVFFLLYSFVPYDFLIIIANIASALGLSLYVAGVWAFMEKGIRWNLLLFLTGLLALLTFVFIYVVPDETIRRVLFSVIMAAISLMGLKELFGSVSPGLKQAVRLNGYLLLFLIVGLLLRGFFIAIFKQNDLFESSIANNIMYGSLLFAQVGIAFGSVLMVNYRYADELEKSTASKNLIYSILAHDLKGPVANIEQYIDYLNTPNLEKEKQDKIIVGLKKLARSVYNLMDNTLDWTRSQAGELSFNPSIIDLNKIFDSNIAILQSMAQSKNITINFSIPTGSLAFADERMVEVIIRNLIMNAIKFSHPGGEIFVNTISLKNQIGFTVKDNGLGIPKSKLDVIFETGRYRPGVGTEREMGTGLGLAICKIFVAKNRGNLAIYSEEGIGTTVQVSLPIS